MYGKVLGSTTATGVGAVVLPNTGGNVALTVAALVTIAVGGAVLLSTVVRIAMKRSYKA